MHVTHRRHNLLGALISVTSRLAYVIQDKCDFTETFQQSIDRKIMQI